MCRYLNLRGSSFISIDAKSLHSLEFIDIRETMIMRLNLVECVSLKVVISDPCQLVLVNKWVKVAYFTVPCKPSDAALDT